MAPIDAEISNSNLKPLFLIGTHAVLISGLIFNIVRFLFRAHRDTPPALHTRNKHSLHRRGVALFTFLTATSLFLAVYHAITWRYASYINWAGESRTEVPNALWDGWYSSLLAREREGTVLGELGVSGWQLGRWMDDTDLIAETNAVSITSATGFWWTYQNFVGLIIWSVFVGIEGEETTSSIKVA
jgi:hypothetical protein